ncbi:glycosyltransferase family 4 protein [Knoellia sp. CPCC 206453]|uniref:glycosyltransferase family 4 protein n=1 Tax=Knoellia pratensis TaxID=3404796 RepID=UPI0036109FB0
MRVLHVNKFLHRRGGAEGYMFDVGALQSSRGDVVDFWGMDHPDNAPGLPLADTFARYVQLDPAPGGLASLGAAARMVWSPRSRTGIEQALARFEPDIVHFHNVYHQLSPSVVAAVASADVPCVMTLHDYKIACPSYQLLANGALCQDCVESGTWHAVARRCKEGSLAASAVLAAESGVHRALGAWDAVDLFLSPSRFLADVVRRSGVAEGRIRVLHNVVDPAGDPATGPGRDLVVAGRLSHEKGVDVAIRAMTSVPGDTVLHVAGDGPQAQSLHDLAHRLAPGRVRFHGRLPAPDLHRLVASCVATVVPSRWHENQPLSVLESFALGVPVVSTDLGGLPELVTDGLTGRLVPADRPEALATCLTAMVSDPVSAHEMGRRALTLVATSFSPRSHLAGLDAAYRDVARGRVAAGIGA